MSLPATSQAPTSDFPPGTKIERYVVLRQLGKGGMGAVYAAYDSELDRRVALKFLRYRTSGVDANDWRARLMREAKAMARLSHPNVVTLYDVGLSSSGRVFLAMEVVEGGTLGDWLKASPRSWREVVTVLCEAGEGLAAAHRAGMIHRDFKLENVLFGTDARPRVTDFGLARSAGDEMEGTVSPEAPTTRVASLHDTLADRVLLARSLDSSGSLSSRLTMTGAMMGTPGYMAPEQFTNAVDIDARADIFAFCATLYRALYGDRPFEGETLEQIAESTLLGQVRAKPKGSQVPAWIDEVIAWGLSTEREARPASMEVLLAALRADPQKRRRRWLLGGAAVVAVGAVAFGVHAAGERRVRECHAMADRLDGVWDTPRKQAIQKAFAETRVSYAEDTWVRVSKRLDDYAGAWTSSMDGACLATRARGEQSEAMLDLRASCLDERLDELRALGDALANADTKTVGKAVRAASSLPSLEPCSAVDQLSVAARLPSDLGKRAEIKTLRGEVAAANEIRLTGGSSKKAWKRLEPIQDRVMATSFGPLITAWSMAAVQSKTDHDLKETAVEWEHAVELAETYHLDRQKADAQMRLGLVLNDVGEHEEAQLFLALSGATLARIGGDPALGLEHDMYQGLNFLNEGKYVEAVRVLEPAVARAKTASGIDPSRQAIAETLLGGALLYDQARFDEALSEARAGVALSEESLGPLHPNIGTLQSNLSIVEREVGRLDDALRSASRSRAVYEAAMARNEIPAQDMGTGEVLLNVGVVLLRLGRAGEAIDLFEKAHVAYQTNDQGEGLEEADIMLGSALREVGRTDEAERAIADARALTKDDKEVSPITKVELLVVDASLKLDRGETSLALPLAEQAVSAAQSGFSYLYDLSSARLVLARALAQDKTTAARAREVAEEARRGFAKLGDAARVDEATRMIGDVL